MQDFTKGEKALIKRLNTPAKVQDYLNSLKFNFEANSIETLKSPLFVLREKKAHCFEGALLGAYILSRHSYKPLVLHLETAKGDIDHVIVPFKKGGYWGALSKTNHAVLRFREPVYKNIRELVMSYFHEYFLDNGTKTLRRYSAPLNLNIFGKDWYREDGDLWGIDEELENIKHYDVAPTTAFKNLRKADNIEILAGKIEEYKKKK